MKHPPKSASKALPTIYCVLSADTDGYIVCWSMEEAKGAMIGLNKQRGYRIVKYVPSLPRARKPKVSRG